MVGRKKGRKEGREDGKMEGRKDGRKLVSSMTLDLNHCTASSLTISRRIINLRTQRCVTERKILIIHVPPLKYRHTHTYTHTHTHTHASDILYLPSCEQNLAFPRADLCEEMRLKLQCI